MQRYKSKAKQKGLSAVEFTLTLPFLLMMFGIFAEFGNLYIQYTTLTKAVQDGARWAVAGADGSAGNDIASTTEIRNVIVYGKLAAADSDVKLLNGLDLNDITVDNTGSDFVTVSATYAYTPLFANIPYLTQNMDLNLSSSSVMRR